MISRVSRKGTLSSWVQRLAEGTGPYRVLVVDDEPMIRALIRVALGSDEQSTNVVITPAHRATPSA